MATVHKLFHEEWETEPNADISVLRAVVYHLRAVEEHVGTSLGMLEAHGGYHWLYDRIRLAQPELHDILMQAQRDVILELEESPNEDMGTSSD